MSTATEMAIPLKTAGLKVVVKKVKDLARRDLQRRGRNPKSQQLLLRMTSYLLLSVPPTLPKWQMHLVSQNRGLVRLSTVAQTSISVPTKPNSSTIEKSRTDLSTQLMDVPSMLLGWVTYSSSYLMVRAVPNAF